MRAFLAAELTPDVRKAAAIVQRDLQATLGAASSRGARLSWVKPDLLHLTFVFLGDIDEAIASPLHEAVEASLRGRPGADLPLSRLGVFPHPGQPRVLWIGPDQAWASDPAAGNLRSLHRALATACGRVGVPLADEAWSAHLTLARIRSGERQVGRALNESRALDMLLRLPPLPVESVTFFESQLLPDGPRHTARWSVTLVG